jgi:membrane protein
MAFSTLMLSERIARAIDSHPATRRWGRHPIAKRVASLASLVLHRQGAVQIGLSAAGVAFWFIIALFPALIAVLVILGLVLDPATLDNVISELEALSPGSLSAVVLTQVRTVAENEPSSISLPLIISVTVSAWSASSGVYNLSRGVRLAYDLPARTYLRARVVAFGGSYVLILIFAVLTIATTSASAWASTLDQQFHAFAFIGLAILAILLLTAVMSALYFVAIGRGHPQFTLLPGAIFSAVGTVVIYIGLGVFLRFTTGYEAIYGALAGVIIVMLVFYVASYVMLMGALVNGQWIVAQGSAHSTHEQTPS